MAKDIYEDTLYGQVLPADWVNDTISSLMLLVDGEEEFIIEKSEQSEMLINYIDRWITAEGIVTETDDDFSIKVQSYKLEDDFELNDDDDW